MSTTTTNTDRSSRKLHEEIRETRHEMDNTLDELGERLHPRHLLDDLIDLFRSGGDPRRRQQVADTCRSAGQTAARSIREHPVPALLVGAGIAWWLFDEYADDDETDWDALQDYDPRDYPVDYDGSYEQEWKQEAMPWHETYAWEDESEEDWNERARRTLNEVSESLSDTSQSAQDQLQRAASKMMALTGHTQREIHSRWASLREHGGSFVDARTGEPYDESYGRDWDNLAALDGVASSHLSEEDSQYTEQAKQTLAKLRESLTDAGGSAKDAARRSVEVIADYGRTTGKAARRFGNSAAETAADWGRSTSQGISRAGAATGRAARSVGRKTRRGVAVTQKQLASGYETVRESTAEAIDEYPLAVGAACFGLGLLGGLLLPRTRYEDELMGETADQLRSQARETGQEIYRAGKDVAAATAEAATEEARRQGLSPDQLAEKVSKTVSQAGDAVKETAAKAPEAVEEVADRARSVASEAADKARAKSKEKAEHVKS